VPPYSQWLLFPFSLWQHLPWIQILSRKARGISCALTGTGAYIWDVGHHFLNSNNNQPKEGIHGGKDIGESMRPRRNISGKHFGIIWGGELGDEKKYKPSWP
jgi:hypothetical protein